MLVTFRSKSSRITLFREQAERLLKLMGLSGAIPGAIVAKDVPERLRRLREGLGKYGSENTSNVSSEEEEETVSLATRAYPLIELFQFAARENCDVIWEAGYSG